MNKRPIFWIAALLAVMCMALTACGSSTQQQGNDQPDTSTGLTPDDMTTPDSDQPNIPDDAAGLEYLYDFKFSERYDNCVTSGFSLTFPAGTRTGTDSDTLYLLSRYQIQDVPSQENIYDSDGMTPYNYKDYDFSNESGNLFVKTHLYEQVDMEYISCIYTNMDGVNTDLGVGVGTAEQELLTAYTDNLYYLEMEQTEPVSLSWEANPVLEFDYAYAWQPFTRETNECRDITFYIRDGTVVAVELVEPFELRYVYGYDREAGLQQANENRGK